MPKTRARSRAIASANRAVSIRTCPVPGCGKQSYGSRRAAKTAARNLHPGESMNAYQCDGYWHIGHLDVGIRAGHRGREFYDKEPTP